MEEVFSGGADYNTCTAALRIARDDEKGTQWPGRN
jgi:hypothetical protein